MLNMTELSPTIFKPSTIPSGTISKSGQTSHKLKHTGLSNISSLKVCKFLFPYPQ